MYDQSSCKSIRIKQNIKNQEYKVKNQKEKQDFTYRNVDIIGLKEHLKIK